MNISIAIMATFERRANAQALRDELMTYPFIDPYIVYDEDLAATSTQREWDNGVRALLRGVDVADWHVVLQDDAIIGEGFYTNLVNALNSVPERSLVSLYLGTVKPYPEQVSAAFHRAYRSSTSWISAPTLLWGVGIAIPSEDIKPMLSHARILPRFVYDRRIGHYYLSNKRKVYYTTLSLVQHNFALGSLIGNDNPGKHRVCHEFIGDRVIEFNSRCIAL